MYHVWKYNLRRRALMMLTRKTFRRWDPGEHIHVPAIWQTRAAANAWARDHIGQGNFKVLECEGVETCGMRDHTTIQ